MGLSSLPTPSDSVLTLVLVNTALTISILKQLLRSLLRLGAPTSPLSEQDAGEGREPHSLTDRFRSRCRPIRFGLALGRRRAAAAAAASERASDCRVCLARFEPDSMVNTLPCGHFFHRACLETWLDYQHATCPLCRTYVLPAEEAPVAGSNSSFSWPWF
ncbi:putative E3 ubiquitin-protein ligase XERICO [Curcuma longa]|uniref:putative E3 ubiquitin-protein ligase XERICO n=1 Tax=Curcuma longa TaxID=136217 RepID=UPI003D9F0A1E